MKRNLKETKIKPQWHLWGVFLPHRVTRPSPYWRSPPHKPSHVSCFPEFTVKQITWLTNIIFIPRASPILFNFSWHCSQSHLSKGKTHALRLEILFYIIAVHANNKIEYIICVNFAWSNYTKCDHWKCLEGFFYLFSFLPVPGPWPNVEQNVNVCARNCSVIVQHWIAGDGECWWLKWTTVKSYNLPNNFCTFVAWNQAPW